MLPEKLKAWDKIQVTIPIQDSIYQNWNSREVETIKYLAFQRGVIICKDAIANPGKKSDDLYLAFQFGENAVSLEEIHGTHNTTTSVWEVPYEVHIEDGVKEYNLKFDLKYGKNRKRMQLLTSTFIGIMAFVADNPIGVDGVCPIEVHPETVKVVKKQKKGDPIVSHIDCETLVIKFVTSKEGKPLSAQSGTVVWVDAPSKPESAVTSTQTIHRHLKADGNSQGDYRAVIGEGMCTKASVLASLEDKSRTVILDPASSSSSNPFDIESDKE